MAKLGAGKRQMQAVRKRQTKQTQKALKGFFGILKPKKKRKRKVF